jgi:hypothetical protein
MLLRRQCACGVSIGGGRESDGASCDELVRIRQPMTLVIGCPARTGLRTSVHVINALVFPSQSRTESS